MFMRGVMGLLLEWTMRNARGAGCIWAAVERSCGRRASPAVPQDAGGLSGTGWWNVGEPPVEFGRAQTGTRGGHERVLAHPHAEIRCRGIRNHLAWIAVM